MNIDYTLAKELKHAGFPQVKNSGYWSYPANSSDDKYACYAPPLEELIEECGEGYLILHRTDNGKWTIDSKNAPINFDDEEYSTPAIAVARLWLALNK